MKRFKNILCAIDPETADSAALERAVTLAENNQASLTLVTVAEPVVPLIETTQGASIDANLQETPADEHIGALQALAAPYRIASV